MKPILYLSNTFDAHQTHEFRFIWEGNQSFSNILVIRDNITDAIIYQEPQNTMQLKHVLPANRLVNGKLYNARVATTDINNNLSEYSSPILFYCFTYPDFKFTNISTNFIIRNATYQINMSYSQIENEPLESYVIELFDESKNLLQSSSTKYDGELKHTFPSLEDNQTYYFKATGRTLNGLDIETDYILVSVEYEHPQVYSILTLENIKEDGLIKIQSNIRIVECYTNKPPVFIDNEYIDLRDDTLRIDNGFSLDKDYVIRCVGYDLKTGLIMKIGDVEIHFRKIGVRSYIELYAPFYDSKYYCYSKYLENLSPTQKIEFTIVKYGGLFSVLLERSD